jgi:uncharacterized protein
MSKSNKTAASICWFEIPAEQPERARKFYHSLFGWNINAMPGMPDYWHIDTAGKDASPDGAIKRRQHPEETPLNYVLVPSVSRFLAKVKKLGGEICLPKTAIPKMGYMAVCKDTEANSFAIWEPNEKAK